MRPFPVWSNNLKEKGTAIAVMGEKLLVIWDDNQDAQAMTLEKPDDLWAEGSMLYEEARGIDD